MVIVIVSYCLYYNFVIVVYCLYYCLCYCCLSLLLLSDVFGFVITLTITTTDSVNFCIVKACQVSPQVSPQLLVIKKLTMSDNNRTN